MAGGRCHGGVSAICIRWRNLCQLMVSLSHEGESAFFHCTLATMSHLPLFMTLYISDAGEMVSQKQPFADIGGGYLWAIPTRFWIFLIISHCIPYLAKATGAFGRHGLCGRFQTQKVASYSAIKFAGCIFSPSLLPVSRLVYFAVLLHLSIKFRESR